MRINVGSRFDHEFADNLENTKYCDTNNPDYNHDLCLDFQGHQTLRINKFIIHKNYKFGLEKNSGSAGPGLPGKNPAHQPIRDQMSI